MTASSDRAADPARLTASEAARRIAEGALTSEALVGACLARIEEREPLVQAWAALDPADVLARARAADAVARAGPLHGVPFGVKDIFDTTELPTEYGSPLYEGNQPASDSAAVAALREAGALVLGKTVTTEFAYRTPGATRNPHHPDHTPGGSSSGSAAAVADGMVPFALGTQTGGSTIRPAAFCGIFAFKPTYGFVNSDGVHPLATALDTVGWFARSIEDLALVGAVLSTTQSAALDAPSQPLRIGVVRTVEWGRVSPAGQRAIEETAAAIEAAGGQVSDLDLPAECDGLGGAWDSIVAAGAASAFAREYREQRDGLSPALRELIEAGRALGGPARSEAESLALHCRAAVSETFAQVDAFLTPSAPGEAPVGLSSTGDPLCNRVWTLLRLPCVALPSGRGEGGLPIGVQLVGRHGGDQSLLELASAVADLLPPPAFPGDAEA